MEERQARDLFEQLQSLDRLASVVELGRVVAREKVA